MASHSSSSEPASPDEKSRRAELEDAAVGKDVYINDDGRVCWREEAPGHPRNWSPLTKAYTAVVITWLEMYMTAISAAGTAASEKGREEYGISMTLGYFCFVTLYLLGQTTSGVLCSPISETFGRKTIYTFSTAMFCVFSVINAAVPSLAGVIIGRFFQGVAAAIPATVAFGNFDDMYDARHRIWVVYLYTLFGMLGLALGPIYSTYITARLGWRWVFYISAMMAGATIVACLFLRESSSDRLLQAKTKEARQVIGDDKLKAESEDDSKFSLKQFAQEALLRPLKFLFVEPLVTFCAIECAIAFGLIYGLTESLTIVYTAPPFSFSKTAASLPFIAIIVGELLNILPRFYDIRIYNKYRREKRRITPESKIGPFAVSAPALAIGLWLFAWTIPPRVTSVHWIVSMIGLACIGYSLNDFSYVLFGYATDSYGKYAASAVGAISFTRTLVAGVFPLFTHQFYTGLTPNVATSILAAVATLFALTPVLFLRYGKRLREKSPVAMNDDEALQKENDFLDEGDENDKSESNA